MSSIYHQSILGLGGSISHSQLEGGSSHFLNINCPVVPLWPGLQLNFQLGTKDQLYPIVMSISENLLVVINFKPERFQQKMEWRKLVQSN